MEIITRSYLSQIPCLEKRVRMQVAWDMVFAQKDHGHVVQTWFSHRTSVYCEIFIIYRSRARGIRRNITQGQWRRQLDNWGGGRIFISSCSALLTSFEIDCFYGL